MHFLQRVRSVAWIAFVLVTVAAAPMQTARRLHADEAQASDSPSTQRPNIVVMLADDMGFGEVSCLNPLRGRIPTPNLDEIAASGMVFTDAHSGSSVCTPTRYGLLTGRYAWRTRLQKGVLTGGESLIAEDRLTIAKLLRSKGYHTALIGKWHLGMLFDGKRNSGDVPIGTEVSQGPIDRGGFDEFHGFHHSRQMSVWIDNNRVTQKVQPVEMLPKLTELAVNHIRARSKSDQPFFLYVPWNSPHSPVVPNDEWRGKSGLNEHADFVMQTDDSFGRVVDALRETDQLENTLILCSSDNGTSAPTSDLASLQAMGHHPSAALRGSKADIWDGGHRVPFFVSWPNAVPPGRRSNDLVCLTDLLATVADVLDVELRGDAGEDSVSFLPALRGEPHAGRESVIHHSVSGYFAIRRGQWKLCVCPGSGGWTAPRPKASQWTQQQEQGKPMVQLYQMSHDVEEQTNLAETNAATANELRDLLDRHVADGRSTPGTPQRNDVPVTVAKSPRGWSFD